MFTTAIALQQHEAMHVFQMSSVFPSTLVSVAAASLTPRLSPFSSSAVNRTPDVLLNDNRRGDTSRDHLRQSSPPDIDRTPAVKNPHSSDDHRRYLDNYPRHADVTDVVTVGNGHDATSPRTSTTNLRKDKRKQKLPKAITVDNMKTSGSDVDESESPDDLRMVDRRSEAVRTPLVENETKSAEWTDGEIEIKMEPMVRSIISNRPPSIFAYHNASRSRDHARSVGEHQHGLDLTRNGKHEAMPERPPSESSHRVGGMTTPLPSRPESSLRSVSPPSFHPSSLQSDVSPSGVGSPPPAAGFRSSSSMSFMPGTDSPLRLIRSTSPYRDRSSGRPAAALTPDSGKLVISRGNGNYMDEEDSTPNNNNNNNYGSLTGEKERLSAEFPPGGPYSCSLCNEGMETWEVLEAHCLAEHSRNPCRYCSKTFAQKANRDRHMCLHTGDKPYGCPDCEERFSRGDKLKMHRIRTHGVQYPVYASRHRGDRSAGKDENAPSTSRKSGRSSAATWLETASNSSPLLYHHSRAQSTDPTEGLNGFLSRWILPETGWGNVSVDASSTRSCWGEFGRYATSPSVLGVERRAASAQPGGGETLWSMPSSSSNNLKLFYPNVNTTDETLKVNDS